MEDLTNKPTNELLLTIKQMELDYESLKQRIINDWDKLTEMELEFDKINKELVKRLKPEIK